MKNWNPVILHFEFKKANKKMKFLKKHFSQKDTKESWKKQNENSNKSLKWNDIQDIDSLTIQFQRSRLLFFLNSLWITFEKNKKTNQNEHPKNHLIDLLTWQLCSTTCTKLHSVSFSLNELWKKIALPKKFWKICTKRAMEFLEFRMNITSFNFICKRVFFLLLKTIEKNNSDEKHLMFGICSLLPRVTIATNSSDGSLQCLQSLISLKEQKEEC